MSFKWAVVVQVTVPADSKESWGQITGAAGDAGDAGDAGAAAEDLLLSHAGVLQNVHVDKESLLMFAHPAQEQGPLLQQPCSTTQVVKQVK